MGWCGKQFFCPKVPDSSDTGLLTVFEEDTWEMQEVKCVSPLHMGRLGKADGAPKGIVAMPPGACPAIAADGSQEVLLDSARVLHQ